MTSEDKNNAVIEKWVNRILLGIVGFFIIQLYNDVKQHGEDIQEIRQDMAEIKSDIKYMTQILTEYKDDTKSRIEKLEDKLTTK